LFGHWIFNYDLGVSGLLAFIGGTGLSELDALDAVEVKKVATPYADHEVAITTGSMEGLEIAFLPRHGSRHVIPPHKINYRANIWALKQIGVEDIIAINAVGGINPQLTPGQLAIPDQLVDYTYNRPNTFFEADLDEIVHIDFTHPYSEKLRHMLIVAAEEVDDEMDESDENLPFTKGTYACMQGPRLETAAEIVRLRRDGCDMVGMTGMPEAALAREMHLRYACLALSVNRAAGLENHPITMDMINKVLASAMDDVKQILRRFIGIYLREQSGS